MMICEQRSSLLLVPVWFLTVTVMVYCIEGNFGENLQKLDLVVKFWRIFINFMVLMPHPLLVTSY